MDTPFELKPAGPTIADLVSGEEVIRRIVKSANSRRNRRPVLEAWSFRIEKSLHVELKRASDKLEPLAMSDVVNGLLEVFLPVILAQRQSPGDKVLKDPDQRAELTGILESLTKLLQTAER